MRPDCKCHAEPMMWHKDRRGGFWRCTILHREGDRRRRQTPGTYEFDKKHGLGRPGFVARKRGRDLATERDELALEALAAAIEGTTYGPSK